MSDNIKELGYGCHYQALKPIIFECGTGGGFSFATDGDSIELTSPSQAGIPKMVTDEEASIKLEFILTRKSPDFEEVILRNILYEITNDQGNSSQNYNFNYYDKDLITGTHIYSMKIIPILLEGGRVVINNCNISAFGYSDYELSEYKCEIDVDYGNEDGISFKGKLVGKEKIPSLIRDLLNHPLLYISEINIVKEEKDIFCLTGYCNKRL